MSINQFLEKRQCQYCKKEYTPIQKTQKFCGAECRSKGYVYHGPRIVDCPTCGKPFQKVNDNHKHCTPSCKPASIYYLENKKSYVSLEESKIEKETEKQEVINSFKRGVWPKKSASLILDEKIETKLSTSRTGDINEQTIIVRALKKGWEVFKNASCTGPADMFFWKKITNEQYLIDAKYGEALAVATFKKKIKDGVKTAFYDNKKNRIVVILELEAYGYKSLVI